MENIEGPLTPRFEEPFRRTLARNVTIAAGVRARLPWRRLTQALARLLVWSCGGALLYACMAATARTLAIAGPPLRRWWFGSVVFIAIELTVHAVLAIRGLPNYYDGRG
jgi:hypothetical protein